jgi:hypothetical protein
MKRLALAVLSCGFLALAHFAGAATSGNGVSVTTYTGGCRAGVVDVNPHFSIYKNNVYIRDVSVGLYDASNRLILTAAGGGAYGFPQDSMYYAGSQLVHARWYAYAPRGGQYVVVYVKTAAGIAVIDRATCRT